MNTDHTRQAHKILNDVIYGTVSTCTADGMPWGAPQFTVYDKATNAVYWCASTQSQHAQNIRDTGRAFITICDSMAPPGEGEGVYIQASCSELTDDTAIAYAHNLLATRHKVDYWRLEDVQASSAVHVFKAAIEKVWGNDAGDIDGQFVIKRVPITL